MTARPTSFVRAGVIARRSGGERVRFVTRLDHDHAGEASLPPTSGPEPVVVTGGPALRGPHGVLPLGFEELLDGSRARGDTAFADFLAVIDELLHGLLLDVHVESRFWLQHEVARGTRAMAEAFAISGLPSAMARRRTGLVDEAIAFYAPLLLRRPLPTAVVEHVLSDYLAVPVRVVSFVRTRRYLPHDECPRLGHARLGRTSTISDRFLDPTATIRCEVGPLPLGDFLSFLPGDAAPSPRKQTLRRFASWSVEGACAVEVVVMLQAADVPPARLTRRADTVPRLGRTLWIRSGEVPRDAIAGPFRERSGVITDVNDPEESNDGTTQTR